MRSALLSIGLGALLLAGCSGDKTEPPAPAPTGTLASFSLDKLDGLPTFFDFPWPSDLRLTAEGTPDFTGFPNPKRSAIINGLRGAAEERKGWPVLPVAYFKFSAALAPRDITQVVPADKSQPLLLVDIDPASPELGKLFPLVATVVEPDAYVPANTLGVAPRPGILLHGHRTYAFVVRRALDDGAGQPLGVPPALWELANGRVPSSANGQAAHDLFAPLWPALKKVGVDATDVAAATVFTTGDVVEDLAAMSTALVQKDSPVPVVNLALAGDGGAVRDGYCELTAEVTYPKFQEGTPPFDTQGTFVIGADGLPVQQGTYDHVPVVITLPRGEMPTGGFPLLAYFHGSGGLTSSLVDNGPVVQAGELPDGGPIWDEAPGNGKGPAYLAAPYGFAAASSALPVNPERLPGASETAYLNLQNLPAFRDTFRQGVIEQRLFIESLRTLAITLSGPDQTTCGLSLPTGETTFHFNADKLYAEGQSMGGMYTNIITAVEPRIRAAVPTGAGGFWAYFILTTPLVPGDALLPPLLGTGPNLTFMHPTLMLLETAWEPSDPIVYMPRLARDPLPGYPIRPIYEPVGIHDSYFSTEIYDAVALAYGHKQAGEEIWPTMQPALALEGLDGIIGYPIRDDLTSADGTPYTGAVIQYVDPTGFDGHALYRQVPAVRHQIGCFLSSVLQTGKGTIVAPGEVGSPCE